MQVKRTKAEAAFWIFAVASLALTVKAMIDVDQDVFWAAACFMLMAGSCWLYDSGAEQ